MTLEPIIFYSGLQIEILEYSTSLEDWAQGQAGRLRALLALIIRMTKRTLDARTSQN